MRNNNPTIAYGVGEVMEEEIQERQMKDIKEFCESIKQPDEPKDFDVTFERMVGGLTGEFREVEFNEDGLAEGDVVRWVFWGRMKDNVLASRAILQFVVHEKETEDGILFEIWKEGMKI